MGWKGLFLACALVAAGTPTGLSSLRFQILTAEGKAPVYCRLFDRAEGWLKKPIRSVKAARDSRGVWCRFDGLVPGTYGASAYQDEDGDNELDQNFLGIPSEPVCVSRDAKASFGPPTWADASFRIEAGTSTRSCTLID